MSVLNFNKNIVRYWHMSFYRFMHYRILLKISSL